MESVAGHQRQRSPQRSGQRFSQMPAPVVNLEEMTFTDSESEPEVEIVAAPTPDGNAVAPSSVGENGPGRQSAPEYGQSSGESPLVLTNVATEEIIFTDSESEPEPDQVGSAVTAIPSFRHIPVTPPTPAEILKSFCRGQMSTEARANNSGNSPGTQPTKKVQFPNQPSPNTTPSYFRSPPPPPAQSVPTKRKSHSRYRKNGGHHSRNPSWSQIKKQAEVEASSPNTSGQCSGIPRVFKFKENMDIDSKPTVVEPEDPKEARNRQMLLTLKEFVDKQKDAPRLCECGRGMVGRKEVLDVNFFRFQQQRVQSQSSLLNPTNSIPRPSDGSPSTEVGREVWDRKLELPKEFPEPSYSFKSRLTVTNGPPHSPLSQDECNRSSEFPIENCGCKYRGRGSCCFQRRSTENRATQTYDRYSG